MHLFLHMFNMDGGSPSYWSEIFRKLPFYHGCHNVSGLYETNVAIVLVCSAFVHFPVLNSSLGLLLSFFPYAILQGMFAHFPFSSGSNNGFPVVEAFGSFIMDIFTSKSDLDLSINFSREEAVFPRDRMISVLKKFARRLYALQSRGHVFGVQPITRARVPILKVWDSGTGIECDISVENKDGMARSKILAIISTIDERFRKLSFMMKAWAKVHGINSSKDRTLNSLSIISIVAFHLQTRSPPILPPFSALFKDGTDLTSLENVVRGFQRFGRVNKESLAELFVTLFIKLSSVETLWPHGLCVSIYEGSWIFKTWNSKVGNISVEDFTDRSQNVARSVGKAEVEKIYQCIHLSLRHMSSFIKGQIQAPMLKELLFGTDVFTPGELVTNSAKVNLKRRSSLHDSAVPIKRLHRTEAIGENRAYDPWKQAAFSTSIHPSSNLQQWGNGVQPQLGAQAAPNGLEWSQSLNPPAQMHYNSGWPAWTQGFQRTPLVFGGSYRLNPMAQIPNNGVVQTSMGYNNNAGGWPHKVRFEGMHDRDPAYRVHYNGPGHTRTTYSRIS
eukprot:TRINITY_DN5629_c0_g1_i5.p1 TRINITY_DN5629_c0_g1~~TRINITY_DN5629_c0_g1_i5.p1  ORF type:complete len:557 (-),score=62.74 TRINITY_DN5629_c0_g1_i5:696-2366(-)